MGIRLVGETQAGAQEKVDVLNAETWRWDVDVFLDANSNSASQWGCTYSSSTGHIKWNNAAASSANGDWIEFDVCLSPGTWKLSWLGVTAISGPKVQVSIDGVNIGDLTDQYSGSTVPAVITTISGILVTTAGRHTIRFTINGRNASNTTGYIMRLQGLGMRKTAPP